ncbi:LXG domain-containing protein [Streptococcus sanguinis]|uniref:LXG domain-containing protein n=1 Tax=Streptococcus sanguinis TaxID=1305 RepID=UPI000F9122E9|nr:LXG domain-containing protein [Streptococcus sanguinis]RSI14840.1 Ribonuclease [Streptococcus sanguinis]RSI18053.1 Ribonuclease [Streptococcus sanguinis]
MSIDMYLEAARTQAESLGRAVEQCLGQNLKLISVLSAFHNEDELKGKAYDSAKNHVVGTVIPIVQGVILYEEAIALACQNFVSNYTAEVDGKSWRQSELEEKIRFAEQQLAELERKSQLYANNKGMSIVDFSASIAVAESARQVFQEILDNLLTFNESSPTIFAEAETYLAAASTGLSQAAQSWDASTQTYLPPRRDADLSWKGTINTGWTKRQEMIEEVKRQNASMTLEEKIASLSREHIEKEYPRIVEAYWNNEIFDYRWRGKFTQKEIKEVDLVIERYKKSLEESPGLRKDVLAKVDPFFKAKIDRMNQKELEEYYPGLKFSPIAPILDHNYYSSEIDQANDIYLVARYQELDSQNPISKHDPNFEQKRFEYISRTGLDPVTGKEADKELLNYATNYTKYAPSIKAGYDFLMVGTAAWSTRAYNKDLQTQRADAQINEYYQIKDAVRNSSVGSQPVMPNAEMNTRVFTEKTVPDFVTRNDNNFYDTRNYKGNPKAYINEDGYLVSVNPEGDLPIHSQIRGGNSDRTPYISTTDPEFSTTPKNYGSDRIRIDSKQIQHDIETGKLKNVEVITHQEIVDHLQKRVDQAQVRYNKNPNDINTRRLNDAKKDLLNTKRDGEVLIKGSIPPEYFTFE